MGMQSKFSFTARRQRSRSLDKRGRSSLSLTPRSLFSGRSRNKAETTPKSPTASSSQSEQEVPQRKIVKRYRRQDDEGTHEIAPQVEKSSRALVLSSRQHSGSGSEDASKKDSSYSRKTYNRPHSTLESFIVNTVVPEEKGLERIVHIPRDNSYYSDITSKPSVYSKSSAGSSSRSSRKESRRRQAIATLRPDLHLASDMALLADKFNLDENARVLLANYDARSLEDFSMMTSTDVGKMVRHARREGRNLPPLQVRKIQVLREWVKDIVDEKIEEEHSMQESKSGSTIPSNWKRLFKRDLPFLKHRLREMGEESDIFSWFELNVMSRLGAFREVDNPISCYETFREAVV